MLYWKEDTTPTYMNYDYIDYLSDNYEKPVDNGTYIFKNWQ